MKNIIFLFIAALFFSASVNAQSTVDSIKAKYQLKPMPEAMTIEKSFPVLGTYQLKTASDSSQTITVTLDPESKGIVWIEGLPEGKFKAYLKKSPSTYRVPAQKLESEKQLPEGTLVYDPATSTLNIALGKKFDDADPTAIFNMMNGSVDADVATTGTSEVKVKSKKGTTKTKTKVLFYTATKADQTTSATNTNQ